MNGDTVSKPRLLDAVSFFRLLVITTDGRWGVRPPRTHRLEQHLGAVFQTVKLSSVGAGDDLLCDVARIPRSELVFVPDRYTNRAAAVRADIGGCYPIASPLIVGWQVLPLLAWLQFRVGGGFSALEFHNGDHRARQHALRDQQRRRDVIQRHPRRVRHPA